MPGGRLSSSIMALAAALAFLVACTEEPVTELDLDATIPTTLPDDPNAEARAQVEELARQQCLDDPTLEMGVVVFVDQATGEEVNRFELSCDEAVE